MIRSALNRTDELLRATGAFAPGRTSARPAWWVPALIITFAPVYGAVMGTFRFESPERIWQVIYSGAKVPLLLLATGGICLPGFFVLNTVLGLRDDFRDALQAILAGQAGLSVVLASLSPLTRVWYLSSDSYRGALLFNAAMFALATAGGQYVMLRYYRELFRRHHRHRLMMQAWLVLYAFVGIQMGWMLRPFVGSPGMRVTFLRDEPFSNAYIVVARLIFGHAF
jgi:hypothetical protein